MQDIHPSLKIYLLAIYGCAIAILGIAIYVSPFSPSLYIPFALFTFLGFLTEFKPISYNSNLSQTVSAAILVAAIFIFPPLMVIVIALVGTIASDIQLGKPLYKVLFNASLRTLTCGIVSIFMLRFDVNVVSFSSLNDTLLVISTLTIYIFLATVLMAPVFAWSSGLSIFAGWRQIITVFSLYDLPLVLYGLILGYLWHANPWIFLLGLLPLVFIQRSFAMQASLIHEQETTARLAEQQRQLQEATTTLLSSKDVRTQLDRLLEHLNAMFPVSRADVVVWDERGKVEQVVAYGQRNLELPVERWSDNLRRVSAARRIVWLDHEFIKQATDGRPVALVPLSTSDDTVGCLVLVGEHSFALDSQGERLIETFAAQAALAIYQARLINRLKTSQIQVVQSERLAAIGTLAAGVAHEFNNLLAGISGVAQLALLETDAASRQEALETVVKASQQGGSITRGLLTFARHLEPKRELADVRNAVEPVLSMLQAEFRRANISVVRRIEPVSPLVCDIGMLAQVMLNLVTNAIDAMHPNGGTLTVLLDEHNGRIRLAVTDTGSGIPEAVRENMFEPFVTTKMSSEGTLHGGTGLGLAISYGIITDHGGTIDVTSQVGVGTTMTVHLPLTSSLAVLTPAPLKSSEPLHMIVVDDEPLIAKTLHGMLTREGHIAQWFTEPRKALEVISHEHVDVIFADLAMPNMDGMTLLEQARQQVPDATQVVVTGQIDRPQLEQMQAAGVHAIIEKPFSLDAIRAVVNTARTAHG